MGFLQCRPARKGAGGDDVELDRKPRLRGRNRLLGQTADRTRLHLLFYLSLSHMIGASPHAYRSQTIGLLLLFIGLPLLIVGWRNWVQARKALLNSGLLGH
jgi:hypothetical protein